MVGLEEHNKSAHFFKRIDGAQESLKETTLPLGVQRMYLSKNVRDIFNQKNSVSIVRKTAQKSKC